MLLILAQQSSDVKNFFSAGQGPAPIRYETCLASGAEAHSVTKASMNILFYVRQYIHISGNYSKFLAFVKKFGSANI